MPIFALAFTSRAYTAFCIILRLVDLVRKFRVSAAPLLTPWRDDPPRVTVIKLLHRDCICIERISYLVHCVKEAFGVRYLLADQFLALYLRAGASRYSI